MVSTLAQTVVTDVACAREYTCACTVAGQLYGWGKLGCTHYNNAIPNRVQKLRGEHIIKVRAGSAAKHCLAINSSRQLFIWGEEADTHDSRIDASGRVHFLDSLMVMDAAAGEDFTLAITQPLCWSEDSLCLDREVIKHSACIVSNQLIVLGGVECNGELSNKCSACDLTNYHTKCYPWEDVTCSAVSILIL